MALPVNVDLVTVTGTYVYVDGAPATGKVTFTPSLSSWIQDAGAPATLLPRTITATLDIAGKISVPLPATDDPDLAPNGWTYDVVEDFGSGLTRKYAIGVPTSAGTIDLATVAPVTPVSGGSKVVTKVNGKVPDINGAVVLTPSDIGALPATYTPPAAPVQSVSGKTGIVLLTAADVGALPVDYPVVQSVNGKTGSSISLGAAEIGALDQATAAKQYNRVFAVDGYTGATDTAKAQAALNDCVAAGGGIVQFSSRTYTWSGGILQVPKGLTRRVTIRGSSVDATTINLSASAPQFAGFAKTAAGDVFQNLTVEDLTVNASALVADTTAANTCGILGPASSWDDATNVSWADVVIRRVKGVSGPINTAIANQFFWIKVLSVVDTAEALQTIKRITVEDVELDGGENGIYIGGGRKNTGATDNANVYLDDVHVRRSRHILPNTPTGFLVSNNLIVGHRGRGGRARISDFYGKNCGDAGLEVNAWEDALVERCVVEDAYNSNFFHVYYNVLDNPGAARLRYKDCTAKRTAYVPTGTTEGAGQGYGWYLTNNTNFARPTPARLEGCAFIRRTADFRADGSAVFARGATRLDFDNFLCDESGISNDVTGSTPTSVVVHAESGNITTVHARRMRWRVDGTKAAGGDHLWAAMRMRFGTVIFNADDLTIDYNIGGGVSATSCRAIWLGDDNLATTVKGNVRHARFDRCTDNSAWLLVVGPTTTTTVQPKILVNDCDVRLVSDPNSTVVGRTLVQYRGSAGAQNNTGQVLIKGSTLGNAKYPPAPVSIAVGASPFTYQNLDGQLQRVLIQGGVQSSVAYSPDGGTTYYELGASTSMVRLEPGEMVKVTYSGAPTMFKVQEKA